jgi:HEAT repeat protein
MNILKTYLHRLVDCFQTLDRGLLRLHHLPNLRLEDIYVPLTLHIEVNTHDDIESLQHSTDLQQVFRGQDASDDGRKPYLIQTTNSVNIETLWKHADSWVLLGAPGAGKTTLLQHLALTHAVALRNGLNVRMPIYMNLERFGRVWQEQPDWQLHKSLIYFLSERGPMGSFDSSKSNRQLWDQLVFALQERRALLLFDSLDTIHTADLRRRCLDAIQAFLQQFPGNRCLITARPVSYQSGMLNPQFHMAQLDPFSTPQIRQFFQQWLRVLEKQKRRFGTNTFRQAAALIGELEHKPILHDYLRSPLLCTLLGLIQRQTGGLPSNQIELYRRYIETFIDHWMSHLENRSDDLSLSEIQVVLEEIGLYLQEHCNENHTSISNIQSVVQSTLAKNLGTDISLKKSNKFIELLKLELGLLVHYGEETYGFFHLAFQEYLAARAMAQNPHRLAHYLHLYSYNPHWQNVLKLVAAHLSEVDLTQGNAFIGLLQRYPHAREMDLHYSFRLAFQCLRDMPVSLEIADVMFQTVVHLYLTQPILQPALNRLLKNTEKLYYHPQAIVPLFEAIQHVEPAVRAKTAELLGNLRDAQGISYLLNLLQKDSYALVRGRAAEALGHFKIETPDLVIHELLKALRGDKSFYVRQLAAQSLVNLKDSRSLPSLLKDIIHPDAFIRARVVEALGQMGDSQAVTPLIERLQNDTQSSVRWRAAESLGMLKNAYAINTLLEALQREIDPVVRGRAAEALGFFKSEDVVVALLDALQSDAFPAVRWRAAQAVGFLQDDGAVTILIQVLKKDSDNAVRWSAAQALGQIKAFSALPALLESLRADLDPSVRWSAAEALGRLHHPNAIPVLIEALTYDKYAPVRSKACQALGYLQDTSALPALLKALQTSPSASVRSHAAEALGRLQDPSAVSVLTDVLRSDTEASVRWYAADALGNLKNAAAIPSLLSALREDRDLSVSWRAAHALELIDLGYILS